MDISTVKPNEVILDILHPGTKEPIGVRIGLRSLEDDALKRVKRQINDQRIKLSQRGKAFDSEQEESNLNLLIFSAMTFWEWQGDTNFNGEKPTFKQTEVIKVFDALPWFRDQIGNKVGETESFFQQ